MSKMVVAVGGTWSFREKANGVRVKCDRHMAMGEEGGNRHTRERVREEIEEEVRKEVRRSGV